MLANGGDKIALEMNKSNNGELIKRNKSHLFEGMVKTINVSSKDGIDHYFIQICFDNFSLKNKLISTYKLTDLEDGIVDEENENFIKYRITLSFIFLIFSKVIKTFFSKRVIFPLYKTFSIKGANSSKICKKSVKKIFRKVL